MLLMPNTAGEKFSYILARMMEFRSAQVKRLRDNPELQIGDVTTINLTTVAGGVQSNVVPPELTACFDCRLSMDIDISEFHATVSQIGVL